MEILIFTSGIIMGVIITIIGFKSGASVYNKAVTDITSPIEYSDEDRTPTISNYNYDTYEDYYNNLKDDEDKN